MDENATETVLYSQELGGQFVENYQVYRPVEFKHVVVTSPDDNVEPIHYYLIRTVDDIEIDIRSLPKSCRAFAQLLNYKPLWRALGADEAAARKPRRARRAARAEEEIIEESEVCDD